MRINGLKFGFGSKPKIKLWEWEESGSIEIKDGNLFVDGNVIKKKFGRINGISMEKRPGSGFYNRWICFSFEDKDQGDLYVTAGSIFPFATDSIYKKITKMNPRANQ